jgi:hypothetical protein
VVVLDEEVDEVVAEPVLDLPGVCEGCAPFPADPPPDEPPLD